MLGIKLAGGRLFAIYMIAEMSTPNQHGIKTKVDLFLPPHRILPCERIYNEPQVQRAIRRTFS